MLVAFEGIDGSGKSTLARAVARGLRTATRRVHVTQEPTKTALGRRVRAAIRGHADPLTMCGLFLADRAAHVQDLQQRLARDEIVLTDRYADSTTAYQAHALRDVHPRALDELRTLQAHLFPRPDLVVWSDLEPTIALDRLKDRKVREPFEKLRFLEAVRANYGSLAAAEGRRWMKVDARRPVDALAMQVVARIGGSRPIAVK